MEERCKTFLNMYLHPSKRMSDYLGYLLGHSPLPYALSLHVAQPQPLLSLNSQSCWVVAQQHSNLAISVAPKLRHVDPETSRTMQVHAVREMEKQTAKEQTGQARKSHPPGLMLGLSVNSQNKQFSPFPGSLKHKTVIHHESPW